MKADTATLIILTPGFPENEADSTCLPLQQSFVKMLKESRPQLNVIIVSFQYPFHRSAYTWHNIPVISFGGKNKGGLSRLLLWRKVNRKLEEIRKENNIMGILSFWCGECSLTGKRFAGKYDIKHFCWLLGQDAKKENKYVTRMQPLPGELLALSDFIRQEFEKNHGIKPEYVIPPGIDVRQFGNTVLQKDIDILGAGSLITLKQYDIFLEIINDLKKNLPGIKAMLCGEGPEKEKLELLIGRLELQDNVTLAGELPHNELLQMMQRAKIFLHTSLYEGFGVVCLEALYGGAHVISFCRAMNEEIKNWHIIKTKDEMTQKAFQMLQPTQTIYTPVLFKSIADTVREIMQLFGH